MKEKLALLSTGAILSLGSSALVYAGTQEKQPAKKSCAVEHNLGSSVCEATVKTADAMKFFGVIGEGIALLTVSMSFAKKVSSEEAPLRLRQPLAEVASAPPQSTVSELGVESVLVRVAGVEPAS